MTWRIGILTGGGDCPGLNTVIAAVVRAAARRGWELVGFIGGTEAVGRLRRVNLEGSLIRSARALGICLGD